ncbi:uncharacterized protein LOC135462214 isoform X2 [Liolophura sinensis]
MTFIEDFCVVVAYQDLFQETGFISESMSAKFPLTLFALEGSDLTQVEFECLSVICPGPCLGENCGPQAKRKRRTAGDTSTDEKSVTMATRLIILPFSVLTSDKQGEGSQKAPSSVMCIHSFGLIVTVIVLAILLFVAMVTVITLLTIRRGECLTKGA